MKRAKQNNLRRLKSRYVAGDGMTLGGIYLDGVRQLAVIEVNIKRGYVKRYRVKKQTEKINTIVTCPVTGQPIIEKVRGKAKIKFD